jgi:Tol biopolymer transport system component
MRLKNLLFIALCIFSIAAKAQDLSLNKTTAVTITAKSIPDTLAAKKTDSMPKPKKPNAKVEVKNVKILNGLMDDFSPMFFENGLLFCSNSRKAKKNDDEKVPDDLNLKYAPFDSLGKLGKPTSFGRRTNSKTHEGPSCFSKSGDTMFLTRNMSKGGIDKASKNGKFTLKIYVKARDTMGNFMSDKMLKFELENYSYCHPTISVDGRRLYFASDMPGGFGGMDLYMIRKVTDSTWTSPINLGARINTAKNELFPYINDEGRLYFSSNGQRNNKGGLDIYQIDIDNRAAMTTPLDAPFNTEGDDFGIMFLPKNKNKGFFSSSRAGGSGGDDIYEFQID